MRLAVSNQASLPIGSAPDSLVHRLTEKLEGVSRNEELGFQRPAQVLFCPIQLLKSGWFPVCLFGSGPGGQPKTDHGTYADQRRARIRLSRLDGDVDAFYFLSSRKLLDMPAIGDKAGADIFGES